jgi:hypothetical protein|tara:strand:- start:637 stop:1005 length:369 start_codon:yes stop_codon:yes gene_type:complete
MSDKTYITFIDNAGRSIFGEVKDESETLIDVKNPVMIAVQQQQDGQMAVQLFPLFFAEFVTESDTTGRNTVFSYIKNNIAIGKEFDVDPRIAAQYEKVVNPTLVPVGNEAVEDAEVIKLFDE